MRKMMVIVINIITLVVKINTFILIVDVSTSTSVHRYVILYVLNCKKIKLISYKGKIISKNNSRYLEYIEKSKSN